MVSLDVFRGLTIASMVMVNNQMGAGAYSQLRHASWNGWTFTDMVFPFFLWIAGVSMTMSRRGQSLGHAFQRALVIFGIGLLLNGFPYYQLSTLRIPGVLQRIALCYLAASVIYLYTSVRGRVLWTMGFMAAYWALMHSGGYEKDTNLGDVIDRFLLSGHLYTPTRDPEGLLSSLPAVATCLAGVLTGDLLRGALTTAQKAAWMMLAGNTMMLSGYVLNVWQPINKNLWTDSYSMLMGGLALVVFGGCYWLVDGNGWRGSWTRPLVIFGMNAMAVYIFHGLLGRFCGLIQAGDVSLGRYLYRSLEPGFGAANASLVYSLGHVLASYVFAVTLYRRGWFLKF